jgi:hypothetical protein
MILLIYLWELDADEVEDMFPHEASVFWNHHHACKSEVFSSTGTFSCVHQGVVVAQKAFSAQVDESHHELWRPNVGRDEGVTHGNAHNALLIQVSASSWPSSRPWTLRGRRWAGLPWRTLVSW